MAHRMRIAQALWQANISAEYSHQDNPKLVKQMDEALDRAIPFMLVFGEDEITQGIVKLKNMTARTEVAVPIADIVSALIADGCQIVPSAADVSFLTAMKAV
jgi:histidyl-tRNA synthetase